MLRPKPGVTTYFVAPSSSSISLLFASLEHVQKNGRMPVVHMQLGEGDFLDGKGRLEDLHETPLDRLRPQLICNEHCRATYLLAIALQETRQLAFDSVSHAMSIMLQVRPYCHTQHHMS